MIRKLLFTTAFSVMVIGSGMAQTCTPNPAYANEPPGLWPDSITNLPIAATLSPYSTVIDLKCVVDTITSGLTIKVHATRIYSVAGMPPGFQHFPSYGTSIDGWVNPGTPPSGTNNGTLTSAAGCVLLEAPQSAVAAAFTSPNANGTYPLIITVDMKISTLLFGNWSSPVWMSTDPQFSSSMPIVDRYRVKVEQGTTSVEEFNAEGFAVDQNYPNPFSGVTSFSFYNKTEGIVNFKVFNVIGKEVFGESIKTKSGINTYVFNSGKLAPGIYICSFNNGAETVTKRIIIEK